MSGAFINTDSRSLWANDKFDIDIAISVTPKKVRTLRKDSALGPLKLPETSFDFDAYDCILIGRSLERLLDKQAQTALVDYVKDHGGNVVFLRGRPTEDKSPLDQISPVLWGDTLNGFSEIEVDLAGRNAAPFNLLNLHAGQKSLRPLVGVRASENRELATVMVRARVPGQPEPVPTMVHRRAGRGQALAIASTGLWRTGFHADLIEQQSLFDPFWDNLILWLISGRNVQSGGDFSVFLSTANLPLGQAMHLRLTAQRKEDLPVGVPIELYMDGQDEAVERATLSPNDANTQLTASFTPEQPGIYRVDVPLPNGENEALRFAVYDDNRERTEISVDRPYLEQLSTKSGGRLIEPSELRELIEELLREVDSEPIIHREPIWNTAFIAWCIAICFAMDWLLRRRGGLC